MQLLIFLIFLLALGVIVNRYARPPEHRRMSFDPPDSVLALRNRLEVQGNHRLTERVWAECPCCGYPTFRIDIAIPACELCDWEEEPDADVDTVERARENFARYGVVYTPDEAAEWEGRMPTAEELEYRREFMALCDAAKAGRLSASEWWDGVLALVRPGESDPPSN